MLSAHNSHGSFCGKEELEIHLNCSANPMPVTCLFVKDNLCYVKMDLFMPIKRVILMLWWVGGGGSSLSIMTRC